MEIRILTQDDIKEVMPMKEAIEADKEALKMYSEGSANIPLRANLDVPEHEGQSLYMYGYAPKANALGVKIVSVYPKNIEKGLNSVPATMVNLDAETGQVSTLMDGTYLTRLRTGAIAGAATDVLARKDSKIFALFGTGGQAETQLEAVLNVREIELVKVFDISKERAQAFVDKMSKRFKGVFNARLVMAASSNEAIQDADIITSVTTARVATFDGTLVKPGCHINGVGSYTPEMAEINEYTVTHADRVYVDTRDGALKECGSLLQPIQKGIYHEDQVSGELGEVLLRKVDGRKNDQEVTLFITTGSAVLDLVCSQKIQEKAAEQNKGTIIEL